MLGVWAAPGDDKLKFQAKKKKKKKVLLLYKGWQKHTLAVDENFSWCSDSSKFVTNSDKTRCVIYISSIFRPTYILLWFSFKYQNNNKNTRTKKCGAPLTKKQKTYIMHPPPPHPRKNKQKKPNKQTQQYETECHYNFNSRLKPQSVGLDPISLTCTS